MEIIVLGFHNAINIHTIMLSNLIFLVFLKFTNINEFYHENMSERNLNIQNQI